MVGHGNRLNRPNRRLFRAAKLGLPHQWRGHDDDLSGVVCFFDFLGKVD